MGNEISTVGNAFAVVGTSIAAGVTLGQCDSLNNAVVASAKNTAKAAESTFVAKTAITTYHAAETVGLAVASGVTFGQIDSLNTAVENAASKTASAAVEAGNVLLEDIDDTTTNAPGIGHIKGLVTMIGDREKGQEIFYTANRSTVIMGAGAAAGLATGGVGVMAAAAGAGAAYDGCLTVISHKPQGQIKYWDKAINAKNADDAMENVGKIITAPWKDAH